MKIFGKIGSSGLVSKCRDLLSRDASTGDTATAERRRFPRYNCELPVELHMDSPGKVSIIAAVARNISFGGMLLECAEAPASLTSCHVSFRLPEWSPFGGAAEQDVMALARVRHNDRTHLTLNMAFAEPL